MQSMLLPKARSWPLVIQETTVCDRETQTTIENAIVANENVESSTVINNSAIFAQRRQRCQSNKLLQRHYYPEGGWGCVIIFCATLICALNHGLQLSYNIFGEVVAAKFNVSSMETANLCATAVTCVMSWSSPALPMITQPGAKIYVTLEQATMLSSIAALGAFFGPFITGRLIDWIGRRNTLLSAMCLVLFSWSVFYFCSVFVILLIARFLAGICAGCVYGTLPMYISEISPVNLRGSLGSLLQFFDCIGYLVEYIGGSYLSYENLILLSALLPLICILTFMWIPESPYFLYNKGMESEAIKALKFFRDNADVSHLVKEIDEMKASAENMKEKSVSFFSIFESKRNFKPLYYSFALIFFQQMSGINILTFYSKKIFEDSGSSISANLSSVIVVSVMSLTSWITITAAKFSPLRSMLTFSSVGIIISMFTIGTYFYYVEKFTNGTPNLNWLPVSSLVLYIFTYTIGFGPLPWVISAALFPSHLKATACALCSSLMWFLTFFLTSTFIYVNEAWAFWIFGTMTIVSLFFIRYQLPETRGKTFQEIQHILHDD